MKKKKNGNRDTEHDRGSCYLTAVVVVVVAPIPAVGRLVFRRVFADYSKTDSRNSGNDWVKTGRYRPFRILDVISKRVCRISLKRAESRGRSPTIHVPFSTSARRSFKPLSSVKPPTLGGNIAYVVSFTAVRFSEKIALETRPSARLGSASLVVRPVVPFSVQQCGHGHPGVVTRYLV